MSEFNLESEFKKYLEMAGLSNLQPGSIQYQETKRAFFGGCGQMILMLRDGVGEIDEERDAVSAFEDIMKQITAFWMKESKRQN